MPSQNACGFEPQLFIDMKNIISVFFFSLLFCFSAFAQTGGKIAGKVSYGDAVLHQVSVRIIELKRSTVTDNGGQYQFMGIPAGQYTVLAHQEGFGDVTKKVTLAAGAAATADFELTLAGVKENVTVTASGTEQSTFQAIESVSTVDSSQITSRAAVGIGEVLNDEPGVAKRSFGPGNSRPVIRGFDGDRVKVATDGVSGGSLASQSGDHAEPVDIFGAERIEIVKGPATLLYGSNAIGGVVNSISGHDEGAHPGVRGYFSIIGGTNNSQAAAGGGIEYGAGPWMFWGNASGQRTGDYKAGGNFGTVVNTFTRNAAGTIGGGYFGSKAYLNATYNYYTNRYGIPLDFNDPMPENRSLRVWRGDAKFNFGYNDPNLPITAVKFTVDLSNYRHQELAEMLSGRHSATRCRLTARCSSRKRPAS